MHLKIKFDGDANFEVSNDLEELEQRVEEDCGITLIPEKQTSPSGTKDGGLTIGLAIAGLALTGIQTFIAALQYWQSQKSNYKILIRCGNEIYSFDNARKEDIAKIVQAIRYLPNDAEEIEVEISRK
jgi:hypothetical protein